MGTGEIGNVIKEGFAGWGCRLPPPPGRRPSPPRAGHVVRLISLGNGVIWGLAGLGNMTTCDCGAGAAGVCPCICGTRSRHNPGIRTHTRAGHRKIESYY